jgi:hypothetical protein
VIDNPRIDPNGMQRMNPEVPVQRQLEAYNAHDLDRFVAEYADDVRVFRPPQPEPVLSGKAAFAAHYRANRFNRPHLHATVTRRIVCGNKVVDHERIAGLEEREVEALAVYEVIDGRIRTVWFYAPG